MSDKWHNSLVVLLLQERSERDQEEGYTQHHRRHGPQQHELLLQVRHQRHELLRLFFKRTDSKEDCQI